MPRVDEEPFDDECDYPNYSWYGRDVIVADNPVIGVLYGPAGEVLQEVLERPELPFGFQAPERGSDERTRRD
jgi:hypothetical protein